MIQETRIQRLQLHTRARHPGAVRWQLSQQLRQSRLHPSRLPTSAILVIRELVQRAGPGNSSQRQLQWRRELEQKIDALARQAVRPLSQSNGHHAPAVLFLDAVELLLCYTQDMLAGRQPWYWHELFPGIHSSSAVDRIVTGWSSHPAALPRALLQLPLPVVTRVLNRLNEEQLLRLIASVHRQFGLETGPPISRPQVPELAPEDEYWADSEATRTPSQPPWHQWVPDGAGNDLQPLAHYLFGISHVLVRAPQLAHASSFVAAAFAWTAESEARWTSQADVAAPSKLDADGPVKRSGNQQGAGLSHERCPDQLESAGPRAEDRSDFSDDDSRKPAPMTAQEHHADDWSQLQPDTVPGVEQPSFWHDQETATLNEEDAISTSLGGAFYLVNLIGWLQQVRPHLFAELTSPWLAIATLMAELLGNRLTNHRADGLWTMLAELAREDAGELWGALNNRNLGENPPGQPHLEGLASRSQPSFRTDSKSSDDLAAGVRWWRQQFEETIYPLLRERIVNDDKRLTDLFCVPAAVIITNTHIDVMMALDAISVDIRRSGLDRSPGWVPVFGYIITFIFE